MTTASAVRFAAWGIASLCLKAGAASDLPPAASERQIPSNNPASSVPRPSGDTRHAFSRLLASGILAQIPDRPEPSPSSPPSPPTPADRRPGWDAEGKPVHVEKLFSVEYAKLFYNDTKEVFTSPLRWRTKEWMSVGLLGGTVAGLTFADESIQEFIQSHRAKPSDTFAKNVAPLGYTYSAGVLGSFYLVGVIWDKPKARAVAQDGLAASVINSYMIMPIMKFTVGRARPDQKHGSKEYDPFCLTQSSMPSGHTAQAFTVASVISAHYESWWVKTAAYGTATLVGWARVQQDRHFTSDCVAGAIIGTFVGHTVARYNQKYRAERGERRASLTPFYDGESAGLAFDYKF